MRMSSGPSARKEKPRAALVDLHRGDAEVEDDAVDALVAVRRGDRVELGEAAFDQRQPAGPRSRPATAPRGDRRRVAVDGDDAAPRRRGWRRL